MKKKSTDTSGGGSTRNLLSAIRSFKASSLKTTPSQVKKGGATKSEMTEEPTNILQQAILNRRLRKVTKPNAVKSLKATENNGAENSPSFMRIKLRKTGRR